MRLVILSRMTKATKRNVVRFHHRRRTVDLLNILRLFRFGWIGLVLAVVGSPEACATDNSVLGLPRVEILYKDPEKALRDGKPVRIERQAQFIDRWGTWLLAEHRYYYEGSDVVISLRSKGGRVSVTYPPMKGPFVVSEQEQRILDCGMLSHSEVEAAVLFDNTGKLLKKIPKIIYTRNCGKTDDGKLFWLHYNTVEKGGPVNVIRVIDHNGETIYQTKKSETGDVVFSYDSHPYRITLPAPDHPG